MTINLPDDLARWLGEVSAREHRTLEDTACEILQKKFILDRFRDLCRESEALAKAAGFESEEDVLRTIS